MISQLTNNDIPFVNRMKLLRYLWFNDDIELANKHQALCDILSEHDPHTSSMTEEDKAAWWYTAITVLPTTPTTNSIMLSHKLLLKFVDEIAKQIPLLNSIDDQSLRVPNVARITKLFSCLKAVTSNGLLPQAIKAPLHLMKMMSLICQFAFLIGDDENIPETIIEFISELLLMLKELSRTSRNPKNIIHLTMNKLLIPVSAVRSVLLRDHPDVANSLADFVLCTLIPKLKQNEQAGDSVISRAFLKNIAILIHLPKRTENFVVDPTNPRLHDAIVDFVPVLFDQYVTNSSCEFKEFRHLWKTLNEKVPNACLISEKSSQYLISHLLNSVFAKKLYLTQDTHQTEFLVSILDTLLEQTVTPDWQHAMCHILHQNHTLLENKVSKILYREWMTEKLTNNTADSTSISAALMAVYSKLHQLPNFVEKVLDAFDGEDLKNDQHNITMPSSFIENFATATEQLPYSSIIRTWEIFITRGKCLLVDTTGDSTKHRVTWNMFAHFLLDIRTNQLSISQKSTDSFRKLLEDTENDILQPLITSLPPNSENQTRVDSSLQLAFSWAELSLLLRHYDPMTDSTSPNPEDSTASYALDISILHPYLSCRKWKKILTASKTKYFVQQLLLQKLRVLLLSDATKNGTSIENILEVLINEDILTSMSDTDSTALWDGSVFTISSTTDHIACCYSLVLHLPMFVSSLDTQKLSLILDFIIRNAKTRSVDSPNRFYSIASICSGFLYHPSTFENSSSFKTICHSMWQSIRSILIPTKKSKKRRCVEAKLYETITDIFSSDYNDSSSMGAVKSSLLALLASEENIDVDSGLSRITENLKIMQKLPLEYITDMAVVQHCFACSLSLLHIIKHSSKPLHLNLVFSAQRIVQEVCATKSLMSWYDEASVGCLLKWMLGYCNRMQNIPELDKAGRKFVGNLVKPCLKNRQNLAYLNDFVDQLSVSVTSATSIDASFLMTSTLLRNLTLSKKKSSETENLIERLSLAFFKYVKHIYKSKTIADLRTEEQRIVLDIFKSVILHRSSLTNQRKKISNFAPIFYNAIINMLPTEVDKQGRDIILEYTSALRLFISSSDDADPLTINLTHDDLSRLWRSLLTVFGLDVFSSTDKTHYNTSSDTPQSSMDRELMEVDTIGEIQTLVTNVESIKITSMSSEDDNLHSSSGQDEVVRRIKFMLAVSEDAEFKSLMGVLVPRTRGTLVTKLLQLLTNKISSRTLSYQALVMCSAVRIIRVIVESLPSDSKDINISELYLQILRNMTGVIRDVLPCQGFSDWESLISILRTQNVLTFSSAVDKTNLSCYFLLDVSVLTLVQDSPIDVYATAVRLITDRVVFIIKTYLMLFNTCTANFMTACKNLQSSIMKRASQNDMEHPTPEETSLVISATELNKLLSLLTKYKHTEELVVFLVANYVHNLHSVIILPAVKVVLEQGIFQLLDVCPERAVRFLHSTLKTGCQEIFKDVHSHYEKYHKFTGKI